MDEDNKDKIDKLNESLYSPSAPEVNKIFKRGINRNEERKAPPIQENWQQQQGLSRGSKFFGWANKEQPIFKKTLWFALGFFVLCLAVATFIYLQGVNTVSAKKIDIQITAPLSVSASNPFGMDIEVINKNNSDLLNTDIQVDYPDGTRAIQDNNRPFVTDSLQIGIIKQGISVKKRSEAILFGQEGEKKKINITLHYHVLGSTSVFEKTIQYEVTINSAPVTVTVESVKELNSNQQITFNIKVTSNSQSVLRNIAVQPSYPFGFTLERNNPSFTASNLINSPETWLIDELAPAESKEFTLIGRLKGEKDEQKYFKFVVGSTDPFNPQKIVTQFVTVERLVAIQLPFISTDIVFGASGSNKNVINIGEVVLGVITFKNNLATDINDVELILKLKDYNLIDKDRISVNNGFYSSLNNTLTWNKQTQSELVSIKPGQVGRVYFNLPFINPTLAELRSGTYKNLLAEFDLTIKGKRLSDANVPEEIVLLDSKALRIGTEAKIDQKVLYSIGPFINTGSIQPKVDRPTSYTVTLSLSSTLNDVNNMVVTATLPPYVTAEGSISPLGEKITFNQNTNQVRWEAGTIFAGQGYRTNARSASFKIILTPNTNQIGTVPTLVNQIHFEGVDAFTGQTLQGDGINLDTNLRQDPAFHFGEDKVIR